MRSAFFGSIEEILLVCCCGDVLLCESLVERSGELRCRLKLVEKLLYDSLASQLVELDMAVAHDSLVGLSERSPHVVSSKSTSCCRDLEMTQEQVFGL